MRTITFLLLLTVMCPVFSRNVFCPGAVWPDDRGLHINAHGGGILFHEGRYYWFGEHRGEQSNAAPAGVTCYSSDNLYDWRYEGIALPVDTVNGLSDITKGSIIERPKVIYNAKTRQFVMYFHLEPKGRGYAAARVGVAVSDSPAGAFQYVKSYRPNAGAFPENMTEAQRTSTAAAEDFSEWWTPEWRRAVADGMFVRRDLAGGQMSRDMTLYVDDDGKAYHLYASEENLTLHLAELSDDYLSHTGRYIRIAPGGHNEAPAIFKKDGRYFLITSGCTGWDPNAARLFTADHIRGPWTEHPNPCTGDDAGLTFHSQSTFVLPVEGRKDAFIFMADRWTPRKPADGRYVWLPVRFENGLPVLKWQDEWDLSVFDGEESCLFEKAYLHLDRHFYLSGDDIWFRAYLMNAQTNEPASGSSKILYAELISPDARILDRKILHVDGNGCSTGDFRLKKSAPPGKYRIRAYTGWMLNFDDAFVFEKEIEVQNIPDEFETADAKKKRKDGKRNATVADPEDVDIEFFPESGSMVSGIENTVAFRATDRSGKGVNVSGGILNSKGDTLALFTDEHLGMGKFAFTPQAGESYYAYFRPGGIPYPFFEELPEPLEKGFTISILDNDTAFQLNIQTNPETLGEFAGKKMQLAFRRSETPLFGYTTVLPEDGSQFLNLPKRLLPPGITRIILYDEQERPWCERLVYIENREKISMQITSISDSTAVMRLTGSDGRPVRAGLSMSVTGQTVPDETFDMESYVWLESEVKGKIERPGAYFDTANADRLKQMDLLLLTQGWRDYVWIHAEKGLPEFAGYRQEQGLKIAGRVKKLFGKKPLPDANIYLFFPHMGLEKGVRYTQTDSLGRYDFGHVDFWGNQGIFINSRSWKQKDAGEIFLYPLCMPEEQFPVKARPHYQADSICKFPAEHYEKKKDWKVTDTILLDPVTVVGRNPKGWLMSDHEITEKDDKRWQSLLFYLGGEAFCLAFGGCPATYNYFDMDGKRIYNRIPPSKISMKEVDRVIVHRKVKFQGPAYTIDVYAKNGAFSTMNYATKRLVANESGGGFHVESIDNPKLSVLKPVVIGYYEARKFYRPEYVETSGSYYGTFFWKPDIRTDANGETVLDYNPGKQFPGKVRIEGLTDRGIPFTVKLN